MRGESLFLGFSAVTISFLIGIVLLKLISKTGPAKTTVDYGRNWLAWFTLLGGTGPLTTFFIKFDVESFARWVAVMVGYGGIAFLIGCIYGKIFAKKENDDKSTKLNTLSGKSYLDLNKSGDLSNQTRVEEHVTMIQSEFESNLSEIITNKQVAMINEDEIYARVAEEIESDSVNKGLWTRLFVECDGDTQKTELLYIKQRVDTMITTQKLEYERLQTLAEQAQSQLQREQIFAAHKKLFFETLPEKLEILYKSHISVIFWDRVRMGKVDDVQIMLEAEPRLAYMMNADGDTPLDVAVRSKNKQMTELLLAVKAAIMPLPNDRSRQMFKSIALMKRKLGLSREQFINYYENNHVPLIRKLLPEVCGYRRNFLEREEMIAGPEAFVPDYDVITELWYADRAAYESAMARHARPEIGDLIRADESNFLDSASVCMFVVDERISDFGEESART